LHLSIVTRSLATNDSARGNTPGAGR
jgi:hypothetical protein